MSFVGIGYDVHRLIEGRKLILGGIEIPHHRGLDGHSDADVLTHAIADALLGAAGEKDIGHHFPNTDPLLKGIDSQEILRRVQAILTTRQLAIVNIDCSLIAEGPKVSPHLQAMKARLSETLQIPPQRIGLRPPPTRALVLLAEGKGSLQWRWQASRRLNRDSRRKPEGGWFKVSTIRVRFSNASRRPPLFLCPSAFFSLARRLTPS